MELLLQNERENVRKKKLRKEKSYRLSAFDFINLCFFCGEDASDKYIANIQKCKKLSVSVDMVKSNNIKKKLMQKVAEINDE